MKLKSRGREGKEGEPNFCQDLAENEAVMLSATSTVADEVIPGDLSGVAISLFDNYLEFSLNFRPFGLKQRHKSQCGPEMITSEQGCDRKCATRFAETAQISFPAS